MHSLVPRLLGNETKYYIIEGWERISLVPRLLCGGGNEPGNEARNVYIVLLTRSVLQQQRIKV